MTKSAPNLIELSGKENKDRFTEVRETIEMLKKFSDQLTTNQNQQVLRASDYLREHAAITKSEFAGIRRLANKAWLELC